MIEPLIFTAKGNVLVSDLRHEVEWRIGTEQIIFVERYYDGEEIVKESTHVKVLTGVAMSGEATI